MPMTEEEARPYSKPIPHWIPETRTVIVCWMMFSTFIIIMSLLIWGPAQGEGRDLLNTLLGMYVGTGLNTSITWWMGDAKGSDANNKMKDSMAEAVRPAAAAAPPAVVAWWSLLTDAEKASINEAAKTDSKIQALIAVFAAGKAEPEHLAALVAAGLLTKERADSFKTA